MLKNAEVLSLAVAESIKLKTTERSVTSQVYMNAGRLKLAFGEQIPARPERIATYGQFPLSALVTISGNSAKSLWKEVGAGPS